MRAIIFSLLREYNLLERKKEDGIKFVEKFVISTQMMMPVVRFLN